MKTLIIFQNEDVLDNSSLNNLNEYIKSAIENGVLVLDRRTKYEVIKLKDE